MELPQEIQYGLETWEPDSVTPLMFLGGAGENLTYLIPCKPTLRWWTGNQYNLNIRGSPDVVDPLDPKPSGRFQIAVYRALVPINPIATATNIAVMVPGTYVDSGTQLAPYAATTLDFDEVLALGGSYWIIMRFSDLTASGANSYQFGFYGWTISDANIYHAIRQDTVSTGTLPTTYVSTNLAAPTNYAWVRVDLV